MGIPIHSLFQVMFEGKKFRFLLKFSVYIQYSLLGLTVFLDE